MDFSYIAAADSSLPEEHAAATGEQPTSFNRAIGPGQLWVVEASATSLRSWHREAVRHADIVLYDAALGPLIARVLPIGAYAERLPPSGQAAPAISARAMRFATDGWRVVQLIAAGRGSRQRLRAAPEVLDGDGAAGLPVLAVGAGIVGRHREWSGYLAEIADLAARPGADELLTVIITVPAARLRAQEHAFTANGLAG